VSDVSRRLQFSEGYESSLVRSLEYIAWWTEGYLDFRMIRSKDLESTEIDKYDQTEKTSEDLGVR
jgi:hypothetical protein